MGGSYNRDTGVSIIRKPITYIDMETGEQVEAEQVIKRVYGQRAFWKLYLCDFLKVLDLYENKQLDVLIYILEHARSSDNTFIGTYRKIADGCKVSLDTVQQSMAKLLRAGFIAKVQNGVYVISPDVMLRGSDNKKAIILQYFDEAAHSSAHSGTHMHGNNGEQEESAGPDGPEEIAE